MISINYLLCTMNLNIYGFIVGIAAVVWWSLAEHLEPKLKKVIPFTLLLVLIGARAYHVVEYWDYYQDNMVAILRLWEGGLSIWGAIIAGLLGVKVLSSKLELRKIESSSIYSAMITPLPLAQAIGRLANAVNGEFTNPVLGIPWWGMEAILDLGLFGLLWKVRKEWRIGVYLVGYGLIRLALQPYR